MSGVRRCVINRYEQSRYKLPQAQKLHSFPIVVDLLSKYVIFILQRTGAFVLHQHTICFKQTNQQCNKHTTYKQTLIAELLESL